MEFQYLFTADKPWNKLIHGRESAVGDEGFLQPSNDREGKILANSRKHRGFRTSICFE